MYLLKAQDKGLCIYRSWMYTFPRDPEHDRLYELHAVGGHQLTEAYYWLLSVLNEWYNGQSASLLLETEGLVEKEIEIDSDVFFRLLGLLDYRELISYSSPKIGDPDKFYIQVTPPPRRRHIYHASSANRHFGFA